MPKWEMTSLFLRLLFYLGLLTAIVTNNYFQNSTLETTVEPMKNFSFIYNTIPLDNLTTKNIHCPLYYKAKYFDIYNCSITNFDKSLEYSIYNVHQDLANSFFTFMCLHKFPRTGDDAECGSQRYNFGFNWYNPVIVQQYEIDGNITQTVFPNYVWRTWFADPYKSTSLTFALDTFTKTCSVKKIDWLQLFSFCFLTILASIDLISKYLILQRNPVEPLSKEFHETITLINGGDK